MQTPAERLWHLKNIQFNGKNVRVVTHDSTGPCSFIAICNILLLRGDIEIQPRNSKTVTSDLLAQLVANYLIVSSPYADISAALSVIPRIQEGIHLNPIFTSSSFQSTSSDEEDGELKLLSQIGIQLVHGWIVDPNSPEAPAISKVKDYDTAVALVADAGHLPDGYSTDSENPFVDQENDSGSSGNEFTTPHGPLWSKDREKVEDVIAVRRFLEQSPSHLTYHGLFHLFSSLPINTPVALFRNSHISVLYKTSTSSPHPAMPMPDSHFGQGEGSSSAAFNEWSLLAHDHHYVLYILVTDQIFLQETSVVWERLEDIDGSGTFVDSNFVRSSPAGGDVVGQTALEAVRAADEAAGINEYGFHYNRSDAALAHQLQVEADRSAQKERAAYNYMRRQERLRLNKEQEQLERELSRRDEEFRQNQAKKKKDCIIM